MKTPLPLALAALLLAPVLLAGCTSPTEGADDRVATPSAIDPPPRFPDDFVAAAAAWVNDSRALLEPHADRNWTSDVTRAIEKAEQHLADGRVFSVAQEVSNARTTLAFHLFWAEVSAIEGDGAKRARVTQQVDAWNDEARRDAAAFREKLHEFEANLTGLLALEAALLAADWMAKAHYQQNVFPTFRNEIQTQNFDAGLVLGLTSVTVGVSAWYEMAADLVDVAEAREGVEPRFVRENWVNLSLVARIPGSPNPPPTTKAFDELIASTNRTGEDVLAVGALLGVLEAQRVHGVQLMFGDAAGRGLQAGKDLSDNVNRSLERPLLPAYEAMGYDGLFVINGLDHVAYTFSLESVSLADLARAWIAVEHPRDLQALFGKLSPHGPPPAPAADSATPTPAAG